MIVVLVTHPNVNECRIAKKSLRDQDIRFEELIADTEIVKNRLLDTGITSIPTLIIQDTNITKRIVGINDILSFLQIDYEDDSMMDDEDVTRKQRLSARDFTQKSLTHQERVERARQGALKQEDTLELEEDDYEESDIDIEEQSDIDLSGDIPEGPPSKKVSATQLIQQAEERQKRLQSRK